MKLLYEKNKVYDKLPICLTRVMTGLTKIFIFAARQIPNVSKSIKKAKLARKSIIGDQTVYLITLNFINSIWQK